jgi:hypothetical protein
MGYLLDTGYMHNYGNLSLIKLSNRLVIIAQLLVNTQVVMNIPVLTNFWVYHKKRRIRFILIITPPKDVISDLVC